MDQTVPRGVRICRLYGTFAQDLLKEKTGKLERAEVPRSMSMGGACDVHRLVDLFLAAWNNPVYMPYTFNEVLDVATKKGGNKDQTLRKKFGGPGVNRKGELIDLPLVVKPTVFLDKAGRVIAWYIPAAFSGRTRTSVFEATRHLSQLDETLLEGSSSGTSWRYDRSTFTEPSRCSIRPGQANISVCWYNQAFDHRNSVPAPSVNLRAPDAGGIAFLESQFETNAIIGALLALVHPTLFDMQLQVLEAIALGKIPCKDRRVMMETFHHWTTPFSGFALIANRETPLHRDLKGGKKLFDILSVFGRYKQGRFDVPLLRSRFLYNPGTAFALPGGVFEHGASHTDGERICIASFVRPNVGYGALGENYKEHAPPSKRLFWDTFGLKGVDAGYNGDIWEDG